MKRNKTTRPFSTREKVLILILALVLLAACYYFFIAKNVTETIAENEAQLEAVQEQIDQQTAIATARVQMQAELDKAGDKSSLPEVAVYDNIRNEINELNSIMASATTYDLAFGQPVLDNGLVRREVTVSFTVPDYQTSFDIVRKLENGSYRCSITDFSLTGKLLADGTPSSVSATLKITFYETTKGATNLNGLAEKSEGN